VDKKEFVQLATNKYGDLFNYDKLPGRIRRTAATFSCRTHGEFNMIPQDFLRSMHGCLKCGKSIRKQATLVRWRDRFIKTSILKFGDIFQASRITVDDIAKNIVTLHCDIHGKFTAVPKTHIYSMHGCPKCGRKAASQSISKFKTVEELLEAAKVKHNNKYTYYPEKTSLYTSDTMPILCPVHGLFEMQICSHIRDGRNCKLCAYEELRNTFDDFVKKANEVHGGAYSYYKESYTRYDDRTKIKHNVCGKIFYQRAGKHLEGQGCLCKRKPSTGERLVMDVLEKHGLKYFREYSIRGYRYRYDFYLPDLDILIEYDGPQHFRPIKHWGGDVMLSTMQTNDKKKNEIARGAGIGLIRISYTRDSELEDYLLFSMSKYYKYRTRTVWYKGFLDLCKGEKLRSDTRVNDVKKYLVWTKNKNKK